MTYVIRFLVRAIASSFLSRIGLAKVISIFVRLIFACQISPGLRVGRNLRLGYGGLGIVVHGHTRIGNDVSIGPNVLIGGNFGKGGVPTIGDRVHIGPGCILIGPIQVGDDAIIAPNSVVNADVEPGSVVGGSPAKRIRSFVDRTLDE
ncbi:serine O-acetyltransferase [Sphingobium sp. CFD-2]|uniref:serine O-acetyltransferase n=1 Tax=Sphingobium sp. CFD-2 TaxID=2878542 RepID=UPI0035A2684E